MIDMIGISFYGFPDPGIVVGSAFSFSPQFKFNNI